MTVVGGQNKYIKSTLRTTEDLAKLEELRAVYGNQNVHIVQTMHLGEYQVVCTV